MPVVMRRRAIPVRSYEPDTPGRTASKAGPRVIPMPRLRPGGARRSRTDDILLAKQALYQLSYGPVPVGTVRGSGELVGAEVAGFSPAKAGRPGQTRTADLTLIRRAL